ncbi:MAG: glycosyltransferase family 4 protein [Verrucomicrobia bacterium]|nr:glycosyltransferase family 4 protein [Kiritimatiellia bacterium]MCO6399964.1 glycosyltransferase family 4 protein [Verrucomicrobiota bacterium]
MKICIDARWIFPELSGIGLYTQELIHALAAVDRENDYTLLFDNLEIQNRVRLATRFDLSQRFRAIRVPYGLFSLRNQWKLPSLLKKEGFDLYHSTNYMMPLWGTGSVRRAVTIHDLIPLLFPDHAPRSKKTRLFPIYKRLMLEVAARADLIIAPSGSTRRDIIRELNIPPPREERVVSIPEGVSPKYQPGPPPADRAEKIILYVGRSDPYKNLPRLVEALAGVRANGVNARLRVVGSPDPRYPAAPRRAAELNMTPFVDWTGYVSDEQLVREYQSADVFCLPSRYEGFGLTLLEAMACGIPSVCSNIGSLPEVAGDAARKIDPAILPQLVTALTEVLTRADIAEDLGRRGHQRAAQFTWERTARQTIEAYRQTLARPA